MNVSDSIAFASRKLSAAGLRKVSVALFRYFPVKSGAATISDFDSDLSIHLDRSSYISSAIYWSGHHSHEIQRFVSDFLRPDMVFADIGANIGEITLVAAKRLPQGRVLAFEPSPRLFERLSGNVRLNGFKSVQLYNFGLFDKSGTVPLYLRKDEVYGTLNDGVSSIFPAGEPRQEDSIALRRFDDVAEESGLRRLDLMKIDVEGAELMVLRGAEASIRRFRPVIVAEIDGSNIKNAGYKFNDLFAFLRSVDYEVPADEGAVNQLPARFDAVCFPREIKRTMKILAPG